MARTDRQGAGDLSASVKTLLDQGNRPWCWAYSATQAAQMLAWLLYRQAIVFDPCLGPIVTRIYGGNSIDDMLLKVQASIGCVPCSDTGSDPVAGNLVLNQHKWAKTWSTDAAEHAIDGWREFASFAAFVSGILSGYPGVLGVNWQGGGHALACALVTCEGGVFFLHGPNSWGLDFKSGWGSDPDRPGWWKLSEKQVADAFTGYAYGGYVICHELTDPSLIPAPSHAYGGYVICHELTDPSLDPAPLPSLQEAAT